MSRIPRTTLLPAAMSAVAVGALALTTTATGDYVTGGPVAGDNPGPAIIDLLHGNFSSFAAHRPLMGLVSVLVRVPFAGLAELFGGGNTLIYRLGALACMLPLAFLATWLMSRAEIRGVRRVQVASALAAVLLLVGPATLDAVRSGHPEEPLAAVLMTGAVLFAVAGRASWSGVLLGLAIGTKQWALLAIFPVMMALPGTAQRTRAVGIVALIAVPLALLPIALGGNGVAATVHAVGGSHVTNPLSFWWPFGSSFRIGGPTGPVAPVRVLPFGLTRKWALEIVTLALFASSAGWLLRVRSRGANLDPLALLGLLALARCAFDPLPIEYYSLAWFVPLAVWEATRARRLPLVTAAAAVAVALIDGDPLLLGHTAMSVASIVFGVALGAYLVRCVGRTDLQDSGSHRRLRAPLGARARGRSLRPRAGLASRP